MVSFKDYLLLERIVGNTGWVYHRTRYNPEGSDIITHGIKPSASRYAMYGKGLYCCYDLNQQLKFEMKTYGDYILKGKIDLNNFAILDIYVYQTANPKGNFEEHLKQIGTNIGEFQSIFPYTSEIAIKIWKKCKQNGYNGIIFMGKTDGKVAVIWNRRNFIPYQYSEDDGKTWKNLNPNISSIKRRHDPEYDIDDEKLRYSETLKELSKKEEIGNLYTPTEFKGVLFLKNVKESGYIETSAKEINLPNLEKCSYIEARQAKKINLPSLKEADYFTFSNAEEINIPNLEKCWDFDAYYLKKINLPNLQKCGNLGFDRAIEIFLPKLKESEDIWVSDAKKIVIPKNLKRNLRDISSDCEIIHPEETPEIKVNENVTFKKYLMLKESLVQIPLDTAYEIFKNEYEKSTGASWSRDKFFGRAKAWEFYGDEKGYVAVRRQRSGFVKLVGMAGDNRSKLKGINDLVSMNLPLWGMVSKDIKDIAVRRGMREPNFLEKQVLKRSIPPEVLGDARILEFQKDGGVKIEYPDVGIVVKYLVGTPQYYTKLREMFGEKVKEKILG